MGRVGNFKVFFTLTHAHNIDNNKALRGRSLGARVNKGPIVKIVQNRVGAESIWIKCDRG